MNNNFGNRPDKDLMSSLSTFVVDSTWRASARWATVAVIIVLCSLCIVPFSVGQISDSWQAVPKEDLVLKENPVSPGSAAMILERQVYTDDEKRLQTEWVRIKVFTEAGRAYADVEIPYLAKSTTIEGIRGRTVQPNGTVVPFNGAVFDNVVLKYKRFRYDVKAFTLPGVESGSVIEYAYTMHWKDKLPDYVRHPSGYLPQESWTIHITTWTLQQELFTRHAVFVLRPIKAGRVGYSKVRLPNMGPSRQPDGTVRMEAVNVAALEKEDYMPPESMLTSRVHLYYEVGFLQDFWRSWGKIRAETEEKFIEKTKFLEKAANEIAPPSESPEARLRKLYARVQRVRNVSYEPAKTEKEVKHEHLPENKSADDIYRHDYAYGNEINFLFTALARSAGFDATIVEVASRESGNFEPQVPEASQLNAVLVQVRLNGINLYFDPASRFCPYGLVPWYETDTQGVRWDKLGGEVVKVEVPSNNSSMVERKTELSMQGDGSLEGKLEAEFTGQMAMELRVSAANEDEVGRQQLMEDEIKKWTPSGTKIDIDAVSGWTETEQPLRVRCRFHAARFGVLSRQRILFPLSVFQANGTIPFPQSYRVEPVYFGHGMSELDRVTISLPTGYQVEALPQDSNYETPFAVFHAKRTSEGAKLQLERRSIMNRYYFPLEDYKSLRQYYRQRRQIDAENVVLHRVNSAQTH
jgi:uncharacterized protein DUF3857